MHSAPYPSWSERALSMRVALPRQGAGAETRSTPGSPSRVFARECRRHRNRRPIEDPHEIRTSDAGPPSTMGRLQSTRTSSWSAEGVKSTYGHPLLSQCGAFGPDEKMPRDTVYPAEQRMASQREVRQTACLPSRQSSTAMSPTRARARSAACGSALRACPVRGLLAPRDHRSSSPAGGTYRFRRRP